MKGNDVYFAGKKRFVGIRYGIALYQLENSVKQKLRVNAKILVVRQRR